MNNSNKEINFASRNEANEIICNANLISIQYPGVVNNVENAIKTLGGLSEIEQAVSSSRKNVEIRFRPNDLYSKPAPADRDTKPTLIIKAIIRTLADGSKEIVDYDVVGLTAVNFKFNRLCDFQYLPLVSREPEIVEGDLEYIYKKIVPDDLPNEEMLFKDESKQLPLILIPSTFSKFNAIDNKLYFDRSKFYEGNDYYESFKEQEIQQKLYRKDRSRNVASYSAYICNYLDKVPTEPSKLCLETLSAKFYRNEAIDKVKKMFEQRQIWSRHALLYHTGLPLEQMKFILPTIAYHYIGGPWRIMWVKFGYDPKNDPNARIYQTFDFRVTSKGGLKSKIKIKRTNFSDFSLGDENKTKTKPNRDESYFILKPGLLPPARQMFYQFCDVQLPEVEAMLARLPPVLPGTKCHKKNGWLPHGFTEQCREIANKYVGEQVQKAFREDKLTREQSNEPKEAQNDGNLQYYEISDSSSSSSEFDSDDDEMRIPPSKVNVKIEDDLENEFDMETVEEINQMIDNTHINTNPGPSWC